MSIPTAAQVPILSNREKVHEWARDVNAFLTKHLITFAWPESRISLVNGNNNDVNLKGGYIVHLLGPSGAFTITGLGGGFSGRQAILNNNTAFAMTISNDDGLSRVGNRILTNGALVGVTNVTLVYDKLAAHWTVVSAR